MWSIDKDYRLITCNKAYKEKIKASVGLITGEGDYVLAEEFGEALNAKWKGYYQRGLAGESFTCREQDFNSITNDYEYSLISINPMYNSENELFGVACNSRDITADIQSRITLENAMNELNKILDYSLDVICTIDQNGNFISLSAASVNLFGYTPEELKGKPYMDFVYKDDQELTRIASVEITQGINKTNFENRCVRKDGRIVPVVWSARWNNKDKVMHCIAKDASEKQAHEAILTNILESIGDAFFSVDNDYTVTYWNHVAESLLGKEKEKIVGQNLWALFPDGLTLHTRENFDKVINERCNIHFEDFFERLEKWFEISAYPSVTGISVYVRDITERKLSEAKLFELNRELLRHSKELMISNAELEQFAYVASHDLQEPLRMVTSFLTQLEKKYKDKLDQKANQYIYFAVDGAKRMRRILLDLLEYSRVGRTEDKMEEINLKEVVEEVQVLFRRRIEEKNAELNIGDLPVLLLPKSPAYQIFQNLISNALKYHQKDASPVIHVTHVETESHWQFMVTDNGIGIDPEYFDRIFIIFQRLHTNEEFSGTGMGLAITKKIVENLGGKIWVESMEGKGSTFYFTLPK
jgi:PAS domain S-box-containing protein